MRDDVLGRRGTSGHQAPVRLEEIAPGGVDFPDIGVFIGRDLLVVDDVPHFSSRVSTAALFSADVVKKDVEGEVFLIVRVDAVRHVPGTPPLPRSFIMESAR